MGTFKELERRPKRKPLLYMVCTYSRYIHYCPREDSHCLSLKELGGEAEGMDALQPKITQSHLGRGYRE